MGTEGRFSRVMGTEGRFSRVKLELHGNGGNKKRPPVQGVLLIIVNMFDFTQPLILSRLQYTCGLEQKFSIFNCHWANRDCL
ncbi:hypothetical protein Desmer_3437 [Desulfosporosinus meridiei DSM 13257]|uniref:Uncharacterized protein n=1 Tax=Desulfosporosinus meridiei (strain ATCC BAA-275 / DSM 13257 / KCTC 12902 / NCIMB 13706 / S10) TaxID=768704 RepID=J7J1X8_DESMD|nr:hypothetical protein Desmer_3437 [Desulfosporosinus meridiei DSM 13257]